MYTIFVNESVIYLTDTLENKNENNFFSYLDINLTKLLVKLEFPTQIALYIYHDDLEFLWKDFQNNFKVIEAAGGVVFNTRNELLWIYRNERWDLPKGKIEPGEEREVAALREVEEECGVKNLKLNHFIMTTYHIYKYKEKKILKVTFWYNMCLSNDKQVLVPQIEEGITKVVWLNSEETTEVLKSTYKNIKLLCKFAFQN